MATTVNFKKHDELDPDNMDGEDFMQKGDLVACLVVIEVIGFRFGNEKITKTTATMDDLEDADKQIKIVGQIIDLKMSSPKNES